VQISDAAPDIVSVTQTRIWSAADIPLATLVTTGSSTPVYPGNTYTVNLGEINSEMLIASNITIADDVLHFIGKKINAAQYALTKTWAFSAFAGNLSKYDLQLDCHISYTSDSLAVAIDILTGAVQASALDNTTDSLTWDETSTTVYNSNVDISTSGNLVFDQTYYAFSYYGPHGCWLRKKIASSGAAVPAPSGGPATGNYTVALDLMIKTDADTVPRSLATKGRTRAWGVDSFSNPSTPTWLDIWLGWKNLHYAGAESGDPHLKIADHHLSAVKALGDTGDKLVIPVADPVPGTLPPENDYDPDLYTGHLSTRLITLSALDASSEPSTPLPYCVSYDEVAKKYYPLCVSSAFFPAVTQWQPNTYYGRGGILVSDQYWNYMDVADAWDYQYFIDRADTHDPMPPAHYAGVLLRIFDTDPASFIPNEYWRVATPGQSGGTAPDFLSGAVVVQDGEVLWEWVERPFFKYR
jgi:hypothetical protein